MPFDRWLEMIFRHPVRQPSWWWDENAILPFDADESPARALKLLTELFETPSALDRYTNEEVAQGLWFLFDSSCSNYLAVCRRSELPSAARRRCIEAIFILNRDVFATRCASELDDPNEHSLSTTCYMLWDLSEALEPVPADADVDEACLATLARVLAIRHPVCQKSALHGLGHWAEAYPNQVQEMIDTFLSDQTIQPKLRTFALNARSGQV